MKKFIVTFTAAVVVDAEDGDAAVQKFRQEVDLNRAGLEVAMLEVRDEAEPCDGEFEMVSEHNRGLA